MTPRTKETIKQALIGLVVPPLVFVGLMLVFSFVLWENIYQYLVDDGYAWLGRLYIVGGIFISFAKGIATYTSYGE